MISNDKMVVKYTNWCSENGKKACRLTSLNEFMALSAPKVGNL